jgi:hypothetical protein
VHGCPCMTKNYCVFCCNIIADIEFYSLIIKSSLRACDIENLSRHMSRSARITICIHSSCPVASQAVLLSK